MAKKINIYKGPVYKTFAEDVTLVQNPVKETIFTPKTKNISRPSIVPVLKKEIADENELFYPLSRSFVNIKRNCILFNNEEVLDVIAYYISINNDKILKYLEEIKVDSEKEKEFKLYLKTLTYCIYYNPFDLRKDSELDKQEFKELRKTYMEEKMK